MRRLRSLLAMLLSPSVLFAQPKAKNPHIAESEPLTPAMQRLKLKLPPGFEIQLVAAEPKVKKPINIHFDAKGRLWVTESVEYPFAAPKDRKAGDTVKILEDFGPDGEARKVTTFADDLNIPIGVLPINDGARALVYSIPNLYLITDTDGDGKADKREKLFSEFGFKDTHGMTGEFMWGFDGWVYCCHGFANTSNVKGQGKDAITMTSGNTYRIKIDGSRIEHFTHGQVNPFGLAFDPLGYIYSTDCHTRPLYQLIKGAEYPSFSAKHKGLGFGPEMVQHSHGSTAIAGIAYYADDKFPKEYHDNLFVGNVVTNRINRDRLEWTGSTPKGIEMPDLVVSEDPWFRPVDIKLGPDGALYVADFYNRIIGHYEVPLNHPGRDRERGRIWRIIYRGEGKEWADPADLTKLKTEELVRELAHPNLTKRLLASHLLAEQKGKAKEIAEMLREHPFRSMDPFAQAGAIWLLHRLGSADWMEYQRWPHTPLVRVHALRCLAEIEKPSAAMIKTAHDAFRDPDPHVVRAAAALPVNTYHTLPRLFELRSQPRAGDTHLQHTIRLTLRDYVAQETDLDPKKFRPLEADALAEVCPAIHRPHAAKYLVKYLAVREVLSDQLNAYAHTIARYGTRGERAAIFEHVRDLKVGNPSLQAAALKSLLQAIQERGETLDAGEVKIAETVANSLLRAQAPKQKLDGIDLVAAWKLRSALPQVEALAYAAESPEAHRKAAVQALVNLDVLAALPRLLSLLTDAKQSLALREHVGQTLASQNHPKVQEELIAAFTKASASVQTTIALGLAGSKQGAEKLLDAVQRGKASPRLLQDNSVRLRLGQSKPPRLDERLAELTKGLPTLNEQLAELLTTRSARFDSATPNVAAGKMLFMKHCASCHQINNEGAKIGPQLDGVGVRGKERLLEDILDPNRNIDQAFRATTVILKDGRTHVGLLLREEGQVLVLADAQGKEQRIDKAQIDERVIAPLSPMPANVAEQIPERDFFDLLAFLLAQRPKK
jgi:putative heme-binding domain-containing protein